MSNRAAQITIPAPVYEYANGAAQRATDILQIANFLAPTVNVGAKRFTYQSYDTTKHFRILDSYRGVGGQATQIKRTATETTGVLEPHAFDYPLDEFELADDPALLTAQMNQRSDTTAQMAALAWSKRVVTDALTQVGGGTDQSAASVDLIDAIDAQIEAVALASQCGELCPVKIIMGPTAYRRIKNAATTKSRFVGGGKRDVAVLKFDDLSSFLLGSPQTKMSWVSYNSADEGATATPAFLLSTAVIIFASADNPTTDDPSFMKTFRLSNNWMKPGIYQRPDGRGDVFKLDWYALPKITNTAAVARINVTA